ncbi:MAG TPA: hypothetical protein VNN80_35875 [Polyangiaceae bacterium]|jgi:hypothetical protein|nr:hypothetical protein [Polyangiaceae bacterium]
MTRCSRAVALATLGGLGCGADLGGGVGIEPRTANAVAFYRAAASTKLGTPLNNEGLLVGAALESRTEAHRGVRYDASVMLGYGRGPATLDGRWGIEAYLEGGTPVRGGFFPNWDFLLGATLATPIFFGSPRQVADLNTSTWFASKRLELVPMLRARMHWDHPPGEDSVTRLDLQVGATLRLRVLSDLF